MAQVPQRQAPRRSAVRGPIFIRLLANLADVDVAPSTPSLADRLGQWLDWSHAIALSTSLDGAPPAADPAASRSDSAEQDECARMRSSLTRSITGHRALAVAGHHGKAQAEEVRAQEAVDYAVFRQHYVLLQRSMQAATGNLRGRLRDALVPRSAGMARLAAVDAAMEAALSPREQALLARVPGLLGEHFERLQQAGQKGLADAAATKEAASTSPRTWLDVFRKDMQSVLLAELDVRFQPIEGLLAALRTR